jgi:hypothetical protein
MKLENDLKNEIKEKTDELLTLRGKLQLSMALRVKKDKTQEIDSKFDHANECETRVNFSLDKENSRHNTTDWSNDWRKRSVS